jgi:hypothetical protein
MAPIGFSTGALARGDFRRGLAMLEGEKADAVELSALRARELGQLLAALTNHLGELRTRFKHVSLHAPTDCADEASLVEQLRGAVEKGVCVVVHPDVIHDVSLWKTLGSSLWIENMDSRKPTGRTAAELRPLFERLPEARLCFDVGHARQVDSTMTEARRIVADFGDRLAQVHMSEVSGKGEHFPMSLLAKRSFEGMAEVLARVPVILESTVGEDGIAEELAEAREVLSPGSQARRVRRDQPSTK